MGFQEEIKQIVKMCPKNRQTMLFSATMTDKVNELVGLSLNNPARVGVDPIFQVAPELTQEFVRVRQEEEREAILMGMIK